MTQMKPQMKIDISTSLNVRVSPETKQRAMRLRSLTNQSLPQLSAIAWKLFEADLLAQMSAPERARYLAQ
jgi:hypothetical protein